MNQVTLPTFIVAGAKKSATTSLYEYFKQHPQIYMSAIKETNFFAYDETDQNHQQADRLRFPIRTLAEYTNLFADATTATAIGEASPVYMSSPIAVHKLHQTLPNVQLIFSLRNPVDRAYSDYLMRVRGGVEPRSVEQAFTEDVALLRARTYYKALARWYTHFPPEQIQVVLFEAIKKDALVVMQQLYNFLGVNSTFVPDVGQQHNTGGLPKSRTRQKIVNFLRQYRYVRTYIPQAIRSRFSLFAQSNLQKAPVLPIHLRAKLTEIYAEDTEQLEQLIGVDLAVWKTY